MKIEDGKVIFTLANGKEFTLPMLVDGLAVGIGGSDLFYASPSDNSIDITFASTMKEEDYKSIVTTITNGNEADWIIKSRGAADTWKVSVTEPTFTGTDGTYTLGSAKITITPPANVKLSDTALLTVTVTDANDGTISVSREVKYFDGEIVACTGGDLSIKGLDTSVKRLALKGSITVEDFKYIRESLTALEVLDISMTDLTELPDRALRFGGDTPNTSLKAVRLPLSMKTIGYAAFTNCRALTSIDTENVEIIGEWAFEQCRGLVEVKLHDGLKEIRRQAFSYCTLLKSEFFPYEDVYIDRAALPNALQTLGAGVFTDCKNMESINMQRTQVKNILRNTYSGCSGITTFYYPNVVETIGEFAFSGCSALVGSFFPASLTSIETNAFHLCTKMSQVYCLGSTPPTLGTAAFDSSLKSISTLFVPEAAISAYSSSSWNPYFKEIKKDLLHP
ncbi:leucine-rich repeat domain-containing protein [Bacteroides thetaiotaomicron]|uniref:leucine-rich repeat domain-containing protein n=1 Tax=Bacteroides thetaiotaomicron TaxID=818 RepID=UPI0021666FD5|nr:leucine-rich repeat domain-containing protein [Bacteroides thetaiotaomicron]MCS2205798.1 leucine-rich repeat domain-containing protein [Bacteroides thetaiotaomicron]